MEFLRSSNSSDSSCVARGRASFAGASRFNAPLSESSQAPPALRRRRSSWGRSSCARSSLVVAALLGFATAAHAQVTKADYQRAQGLRERYQNLAVNVPDPAVWVGKTNRFVYRKAIKGGHEFVMVDAVTTQKQPAFDHARLAASLSTVAGTSYQATRLPFNAVRFGEGERTLELTIEGSRWTCTLADYICRNQDIPVFGGNLSRRVEDGTTRGAGLSGPAGLQRNRPKLSPDGKWEALVENFNVAVRPARGAGGNVRTPTSGRAGTGTTAGAAATPRTTAVSPGTAADTTLLSTDGSEGNYYDLGSLQWSPDSQKIAAYRVRPGYRRTVHYVESSPEDQLQPKHSTLLYNKPGDVLDLEQPIIFHVATKQQVVVSPDLFPNPFNLGDLAWRKDSKFVTFEYNQRGHQVYRIIEIAADTGKTRAVVSEEVRTFFYYNATNTTRSSGKKFRYDAGDGKEIIWMSERDGWNHLYLYDGATGTVKQQITKGEWVVRSVEKVDEAKRQIWFSANGMTPGKDPYFLNFYRINFDGSGLTPLTTADADHDVKFSDDGAYYVDTYSRVDLPTVSELHKSADGSLVATLEKSDITALTAAGWKAPEVFVAKGRDSKTDIWGVILRPSNFNRAKKYPVIESIYAGPQGSFVPKNFSAYSALQAQAELGFIVVQIDGMGTSNRSKAFHDYAFQNIGDAGFPDRILWHKAVAAKYPSYDITRVGIYGGSAGGQNSLGGLLFHPEFYKVAVSYAGCHDNRMDKLWWNEQWMGWPIGPQYSASSNVDNAYRLQGNVLLIVGELDTNVDPSSTMQVVNALIKANKNFDLLIIPGAEHSAGRGGAEAEYGEHKRFDYFVQHLYKQLPPEWNNEAPAATAAPSAQAPDPQ
jgi:dipeptidyl aminopeptidase/acylaminoacyl peptidase